MENLAQLIAEFGFPVVMSMGMGYFIWYVWKFITIEVKPALGRMFTASIKLTDQLRMLDQDMLRLQEKVNTVLEYRERQELLQDAKEKQALEEVTNEKK
jgi:hypothetical protein